MVKQVASDGAKACVSRVVCVLVVASTALQCYG